MYGWYWDSNVNLMVPVWFTGPQLPPFQQENILAIGMRILNMKMLIVKMKMMNRKEKEEENEIREKKCILLFRQ